MVMWRRFKVEHALIVAELWLFVVKLLRNQERKSAIIVMEEDILLLIKKNGTASIVRELGKS